MLPQLENTPTVGSVESSDRQKRLFAKNSLAYNVEHSAKFRRLFPELVQEHNRRVAAAGTTAGAGGGAGAGAGAATKNTTSGGTATAGAQTQANKAKRGSGATAVRQRGRAGSVKARAAPAATDAPSGGAPTVVGDASARDHGGYVAIGLVVVGLAALVGMVVVMAVDGIGGV